jgi:hypothetical protein
MPMISNTMTVNANVVRRGIILIFPVAWQRDCAAAAILSGAGAWGARSAVIAEILPRLKCFLKQGSSERRLTALAKQHIRWLGCGAPQRGLPTPCHIDSDETYDHTSVGARAFYQGRCH